MANSNFENSRVSCKLREGTISEERIFENHCHPQYELIAVLGGAVSAVIEGSKIELTAGEVAIIPPLCYHSIYASGGRDYKRITALFGEELVPSEIAGDFKGNSAKHYVSSHSSVGNVLDTLRSTLLEEHIEKYPSLIESLMVQLIYIHTYKRDERKEGEANPRVKLITEYIDAHISEKIHLDDIASSLFLSKSTVCHLFCEEMKISVKQYILQKKLSYASKLMSEGVSAADAALRIGYENYANFYKVYKKIFGVNPAHQSKK